MKCVYFRDINPALLDQYVQHIIDFGVPNIFGKC